MREFQPSSSLRLPGPRSKNQQRAAEWSRQNRGAVGRVDGDGRHFVGAVPERQNSRWRTASNSAAPNAGHAAADPLADAGSSVDFEMGNVVSDDEDARGDSVWAAQSPWRLPHANVQPPTTSVSQRRAANEANWVQSSKHAVRQQLRWPTLVRDGREWVFDRCECCARSGLTCADERRVRVVCETCKIAACPSCDRACHNTFGQFHSREAQWADGSIPRALDADEFVGADNKLVTISVLPTREELVVLTCGQCHTRGAFECTPAADGKRLVVWTEAGHFTRTALDARCAAPGCTSRACVLTSAHLRDLLHAEALNPRYSHTVVTHSAIKQLVYWEEKLNKSVEAYGRTLEELSIRRCPDAHIEPVQLSRLVGEYQRRREMLLCFEILPGTRFTCPACPVIMRMLCVDGNFKATHYEHASRYCAEREPVVGMLAGHDDGLFVQGERAAACVKTLGEVADGVNGDLPKSCGVARVDAMRGKTHGTHVPNDIDGLYAGACGHGVLVKAFDFKGGEKGTMVFAMLMLNGKKASIICGDSVCRLHRLFARLRGKPDQLRAALAALNIPYVDLEDLLLAVNAMHVKGHCFWCQLANSIRHTLGAGRMHGEVVEQAFRALSELAPRTRNRSLASRANLITAFAITHNHVTASTMPVLIVVAFMDAEAQLRHTDAHIASLCRSLIPALFADAQEPSADWRRVPELKAMLDETSEKALHNITSDALVGADTDWPNLKDKATVLKLIHTVEYTAVMASLAQRAAAGSAHDAARRDTLDARARQKVAKLLRSIRGLVPTSVQSSWPAPPSAGADAEAQACIRDCAFPWRSPDELGNDFKDRVRLLIAVNRAERCREELAYAPADIQSYIQTYEGYVRRMDSVIACLQALLRDGFTDEGALKPDFTCPHAGSCEAHVHPTVAEHVRDVSAARGALTRAQLGRATYLELQARGIAAKRVMDARPTLPRGKDGRVVKDAKAAVSKMMLPLLEHAREELGQPRRGGSGVPALYSRCHDVRGEPKDGSFAAYMRGAGGEPGSAALEDADDASDDGLEIGDMLEQLLDAAGDDAVGDDDAAGDDDAPGERRGVASGFAADTEDEDEAEFEAELSDI